MDLQLLTLVKLAEQKDPFLDPKREDAYYAAIGELPWAIRWTRSVFMRAITLLSALRSIFRQPVHDVTKRKAFTG